MRVKRCALHWFGKRRNNYRTNIFKDFLAGIRDIVVGRSGAYEQTLREAKDLALKEMENEAVAKGANAIIGVDLDYETVGQGSMLMVTACGTAVVLE